jgi:UDP-2,3-diacylglucosamine pyrophosphatase LpxH
MPEAIVLSDIHLGSENCQAKRLAEFLERLVEGQLVTDRLILNGDVFDSIDFRRLNKNHWRVLSQLRKLSDRLEIIWLAGNHDGSAEIVSHLLGVTVKDRYILRSGGRRLLILHGHVFDEFIDNHPILTWLADRLYKFLQWIDKSHSFAKRAKHGSKTFLRCAKKIEEGAVEMARRKRCSTAICGHSHVPCAHEDQALPYYNSGCWTELPGTYLTVADGIVRLNEFSPALEPLANEVEALAVGALAD